MSSPPRIVAELDRIGCLAAAGDRCRQHAGGLGLRQVPDYVSAGCGIGRDATLYLLERGVRLTGTDGWSWDAPFVHNREKRPPAAMPG